MDILIRAMEKADLEKIQEIDRLSFSLPWPASSFKYELEQNSVSRCWVAVHLPAEGEGERIAGMLVAWLIADEVHIATLAIHPVCRGRRIAQKLLAHTLIDATRDGGTRSFLEVRSSNLAARNLYEKFGYVVSGVRKRYYKDNQEDAILMELNPIDVQFIESLL